MVAVVLPGVMAAGNLDAAVVLLACAWCSDALDGRLARVSAGDTRLHGLGLVVDTTVVAPGSSPRGHLGRRAGRRRRP